MTPAERELLLALADRLILGLHNDAAKIRILAAQVGAEATQAAEFTKRAGGERQRV